MTEGTFWKSSWDEGMADLDPELFETSYVDVTRQSFRDFAGSPAFTFLGVEASYAELDAYANRFAHMLLANGMQKGDVVGINLPNIPEYIIAWLGTFRAGCVVSGVSPLLSAEEMEYQLKDSNARVLVTLDAIFAARFKGIAARLPDLRLVVAGSVGGFLPGIKRFFGKLLGKIPKGAVTPLEGKVVYPFKEVIRTGRFPADELDVEIGPDDLAYLQYTGGTTGAPKGAMLSHRNIVSDALIVQRWLDWERGRGVALSAFPLFHVAGLAFCEGCVMLGWKQILIPNPRDTDHICAELAKHRPTVLANVPSLYQILLTNPKFKTLDHSNLQICISAASPFPEQSQRELEAIVGEGKLLETYGMTETSPLTTMNPSRGPKKLGSIGLPLLNTDIKLLDPTTGEEVPVGQPGEICARGPQIMVGYYNRPEETREAIDAEGYIHTGDVAVFDEAGYLRIVDRTKDMIIVGGFKVFSKKVEEILAEHPAVEMIALIGEKNPDRPGSEIVKAFMTLAPGFELEGGREAIEESILAFARQKLAPYEVPKSIEIRDELPLTPIGKIDKKKLRK
ncbi:MAG: AMP-binding protein [Deltaproteobacteria bacterium]|nr:AMP-binding protein [Deltaproteobacteria bacterium]